MAARRGTVPIGDEAASAGWPAMQNGATRGERMADVIGHDRSGARRKRCVAC